MIKNIYKVIILVTISMQVFSQVDNFESKVETLVKEVLQDQKTGIAVGVMHQGEMVYKSGFGKADVELEVDMNADHIFRIGSITKQFTALAILKLLEDDKLYLDDPIQKFIPDYNTLGKVVTLEHLLTHTSGIPSYTSAPSWDQETRKRDFQPLELIREFATDSLEFDPGSRFKYNNTGYFMLGYIIEQVSEKKYEDYIQEHFFDPLNMSASHYGSNHKIISNRASGYGLDDSGQLVNSYYLSMSQPYAAGSLLSTVTDLALWNKNVFDHKVVSEGSLNLAHTPYTLKDGSSTGYGYGWGIGEQYGMKTIAHGGGINGYLSMGVYFPEEDLYVAALSNCTCVSPDGLASKIGAAYLGIDYEKKVIILTRDQMLKFEGEYQILESMPVRIFLENDQLMVKVGDQPKAPIFPSSSHKFFLKIVEADIEFNEQDGVVNELIIYQGGQQVKGSRIDKP